MSDVKKESSDDHSGEKIIEFLPSSSLRSLNYNKTVGIPPTEKDLPKSDTTAKINQEKNISIILHMILCEILIMLYYLVKCARKKEINRKHLPLPLMNL